MDYDSVSFKHGYLIKLDRGFDFYAPLHQQTTVDANGRRLLFGWMGNAKERLIEQVSKVVALSKADIVHWMKLKMCRIFKDTSYIEIFVNDGEEVFSSRVFDDPEVNSVCFSVHDGSAMIDVKKWELKKS